MACKIFDGITAKSCVRNRRLFLLLPFLIFVASQPSQLPKSFTDLLHLGKFWGLTPERRRHGTALPEYLRSFKIRKPVEPTENRVAVNTVESWNILKFGLWLNGLKGRFGTGTRKGGRGSWNQSRGRSMPFRDWAPAKIQTFCTLNCENSTMYSAWNPQYYWLRSRILDGITHHHECLDLILVYSLSASRKRGRFHCFLVFWSFGQKEH